MPSSADTSAVGDVLAIVANPPPLDGSSEKKPSLAITTAPFGQAPTVVANHSTVELAVCLLY